VCTLELIEEFHLQQTVLLGNQEDKLPKGLLLSSLSRRLHNTSSPVTNDIRLSGLFSGLKKGVSNSLKLGMYHKWLAPPLSVLQKPLPSSRYG
jgi:hypothetical protein